MNGIKLDGSDGGADHRMNLKDQSCIGTFYRSADNDISLFWGTHEQPGKGQDLDFFGGVEGTTAHIGVEAVAAALWERVCVDSRTVALRDYYPAWQKQLFKSTGGKPLFVSVEDASVFQLFFDDHAHPENPSIADVIDVREYPRRMPMAQVYNIHLVKADPLQAIPNMSYFWDEVCRCESAKAAQFNRRRKVARLLHDAEAIRTSIMLLGGAAAATDGQEAPIFCEAATAVHYTAWRDLDSVKHAAPFCPDATDEPAET